MNDRDLLAAYDDMLDADDGTALSPVVRDLELVYPRVAPPPRLVQRLRTAAQPRRQRFLERLTSRRLWPRRRLTALLLAVLISVPVAGSAGYAMHLFGGSSQTRLASRCSGIALSIDAPAFEVSSPQQFVAQGGTLVPHAHEMASRLAHPQYWVIPSGANIVNTCAFKSVSQVQIGRNARNHTDLDVFSVVPFGQATRPWAVPNLTVPARADCPVRTNKGSIAAPDHRPLAQLAHVPAGLDRTITLTLPPCASRRPPRRAGPTPPPADDVSFRVFSQVRYTGSAGTLAVVTARPSPAALRPGLDLGNRIGALPDGTRLFDTPCGGSCPGNTVRWLRNGLIIGLSGTLSVDRLQALAAEVVVR